ncbi:MAG: class II glutamine amidotransferase [Thermoplasmata archaeon]|nr:class II glutamine amidotransferase [Thermoplasmata archaeon]
MPDATVALPMCRLFGLLGGSTVPAEPWLLETDRSLLRQANSAPKNRQSDGWGIAWYKGTRTPRIEKGTGNADEAPERAQFEAAARAAHGPVVVGHLRKASNPMRLPHHRLIAPENSQPFTFGGMIFAHNGEISFPRATRPQLGKYESNVKGVNDSEVLFWLLVQNLDAVGDPLAAYVRTVGQLDSVWNTVGRPAVGPYSGLNVLFARGPNELWAFCKYRGEHGGRFFDPARPYYEMTYRADARHAIVGSEPFDSSPTGWMPLPNGTFLHAQIERGLVTVRTGPIPTSSYEIAGAGVGPARALAK